MKSILSRLAAWFYSFEESDDEVRLLIRSPEDGARVAMVGWY